MSRIAGLAAKNARGQQGKKPEEAVRTELRRLSDADIGFDFQRQYDARTSMGRIPKQTGDFLYRWLHSDSHGNGVIEVKETKHEFRLPRANFDPGGWGVLRKAEFAGAKIVVIVYHSTTKKWRVVPWGWFKQQADAASWHLATWPTYDSAAEALAAAELCS